jgi:hypothetical protein
MIRIRRLTTILAAFFLLAACTTTTPAGERVEFWRLGSDPAAQAARDRIRATCVLIKTERYAQNGGIGTRRDVRNYAATIQADAVLWTEYNDSDDNNSRAEFYRCKSTEAAK